MNWRQSQQQCGQLSPPLYELFRNWWRFLIFNVTTNFRTVHLQKKYKMVRIRFSSWSLTKRSHSSTTLESHHWILSEFLRNFITDQLDRAVALVLDFCFSRSTFRPFLRLLNNGYNDLLFWSHYFYFPHQVPTPQCRTCIVPPHAKTSAAWRVEMWQKAEVPIYGQNPIRLSSSLTCKKIQEPFLRFFFVCLFVFFFFFLTLPLFSEPCT